jgi:hypothetical protein
MLQGAICKKELAEAGAETVLTGSNEQEKQAVSRSRELRLRSRGIKE